MDISHDMLLKIASDTAEFVRNSALHIEKLEKQLAEKEAQLSKMASGPKEKVELVKVASLNMKEVEKVADGLVKIGFVQEGERDHVVQRYMSDPSEILDLAASFVLPLAGDSSADLGTHIDKHAKETRPERGAASERPERSISEILRSVQREIA